MASVLKLKKPTRTELDAKLAVIATGVSELNEQIKVIREKMDAINRLGQDSKGAVDEVKATMNTLNVEKRALMLERAKILAERDTHRTVQDGHKNAEKTLRTELRFRDIAACDKQIRDLTTLQATTSMSLTEEKKLLKELKTLQNSKKSFAVLEDIAAEIEKDKVARAAIDKKYNEKMVEVEDVGRRIAAHRLVWDEVMKTVNEGRNELPELRNKLGEHKGLINEKKKEMKALEDVYRTSENEYYTQVKEERKRLQAIRDMEIETKKAEYEAKQKALEAAELAKIPYEEEMNECEFLISYLERIMKPSSGSAAGDVASSSEAKVPTTSSSFAGMKMLVKKDDLELEQLNNSKKSKKKKAAGSNNASTATAVLTHDTDTLDVFSFFSITPALTAAGIPDTINALKEKKEWYKTQERGAVPTFSDKRKKEVKDKDTEGSSSVVKSPKPSKKKNNNTASTSLEHDFPSLGVAPATVVVPDGADAPPGLEASAPVVFSFVAAATGTATATVA